MTLDQKIEDAKLLLCIFEKGIEDNAIFGDYTIWSEGSSETIGKEVAHGYLKTRLEGGYDIPDDSIFEPQGLYFQTKSHWVGFIKHAETIIGISYSGKDEDDASQYLITPDNFSDILCGLKDMITQYESVIKKTKTASIGPH